MKITSLLILLLPVLAFAHGSAVDKQGGYFNRKTILTIATKSLVSLYTSKQKKPTDKPTLAHIAEYITAKTGRTG